MAPAKVLFTFRPDGEGRTGPLTREIQRAFHAAVRGEDPRYASWITLVTPECLPEGWRAETVAAGLTNPRRVSFEEGGGMLVAEAGTGVDDGRTTWRELKGLNQLGVTRGTLQVL